MAYVYVWCLKITRRGFLDEKWLYKTGSWTCTVIPSAIQLVLTPTRHVGTLVTLLGFDKGHFHGMRCLLVARGGLRGRKMALQDCIMDTHSNAKRNTTCSDTNKTCWDPPNTLGLQQGTLPWHEVSVGGPRGAARKENGSTRLDHGHAQ